MSRANIASHESSMYDKAAVLMERIAERAEIGQTIPLFPIFRCMTLDAISDFAFGKPSRALHLEDFQSHTFEAIEKGNGTVLIVRTLHTLIKIWARHLILTIIVSKFPTAPSAIKLGDSLQP
jgi:hypothetical protein